MTPPCASVDAQYDIAVVLGGGSEADRRTQRERTGRIHAATRLYHEGKVAHLHLTGGGPDGRSANAALLARLARDEGVPDDRLSLESRSLSTLQNALFSRPDLPPGARLLIVTEAFHGWRARASFAWAGLPAEVCASSAPWRPIYLRPLVPLRETAAWGVNILRAGLWLTAETLGLEQRLPQALLI
ncbi:YdcF family protein [Maliponia aquimaris]|uniref:DUF218 domain-containing protein n=1 Tax=Maliponia aquimaris TaxID=1673631 RepID=A0A238L023_9RHOB|nr:YdcF family protein [Maliponia aquimaris]SMX48379.1 hypothetical protein MAA8898_03918 [Maliponia aquimaris]